MILEIIPQEGVARGRVLVLRASQVLVRQDNGTPIGVAAHYGPDGAYFCTASNEADFNRTLKALGMDMTVVVNTLQLPPPLTGAKLLMSPTA